MLEKKFFEIIASFVLLIVVLIVKQIFRAIIRKHASRYNLEIGQRKYANKFFSFLLTIIFVVGLGMIWDLTLKGLSIYFASFFTIVGVALFAYWSILSNITSSIILFFNSPMRIGSEIEIMDKDDGVAGIVVDISFFSIHIQTKDGNIVSYPNNLAIQKPIKQINNK